MTTNQCGCRCPGFFAKIRRRGHDNRDTRNASIIQPVTGIPETPLNRSQVLVYQVPIRTLRGFLDRARNRKPSKIANALRNTGLDARQAFTRNIAANGSHTSPRTYCYPVKVEGAIGWMPSPRTRNSTIRKNATVSEALHCLAAGREKAIYAIRPHTEVVSLDFEDHPVRDQHF